MENKHNIKITLLPNQYMQFPNYSINKQKGQKRSHHKSYQGISKPQINPNQEGLVEQPDLPVITYNHPITKKPEKKVSLFSKFLLFLE